MGFVAAPLAIGSLLLGAVGTGVQYFGAQAAAKSQAQFGLMNAQAAAQSAQLQGRQQMLQAQLQQAAASSAAKSAAANAAAMRDQTEAESRIAQENLRRSRNEFAKTFAEMRAGAGSSGVLETTGSPLDFLVSAASDQQMFEAEQRWADENNRRKGYRAAEAEAMQGKQSTLNANLYALEGVAAQARARLGVTQAKLDGYAASAQARGSSLAAFGGLAGNLAGLAQTGVTLWNNRTPRFA